jgi:hypothetical protein
MPARSDPDTVLQHRARIGVLDDLYGPLLTERQRQMLRLYYGEDLSLGEVAERAGISRQAVHDLLRRAIMSLEGYETRLGFAGLHARRRARLDQVTDLLERAAAGPGDGRDQALNAAAALVRQLAEE